MLIPLKMFSSDVLHDECLSQFVPRNYKMLHLKYSAHQEKWN